MTAVREMLFVAIEARLRAIANIAEVERMPSGDPASFPALHIHDQGQRVEEHDAAGTRYAMGITIEGFVEQYSGPKAHAALHDLYVDTVHALMTEPPLDGMAETIDEGAMNVDVAELAAERRLSFALNFVITFPTDRGNPAQPA